MSLSRGPIIMLVLLIVLAGGGGAVLLFKTGPEAPKVKPEIVRQVVEIHIAKRDNHSVVVRSQGDVIASRRTQLASEVTGEIIDVSVDFVVGGVVRKGDVLIELSRENYTAAVALAESQMAECELQLRTEESRARQARRDWEKLGGGREADPLLLRVPQLARVRALMISTEESLAKAHRDLERTKIVAPYNCRILSKNVELGAVVASGATLAVVQSVDELEVRLPLSLTNYGYLRNKGGDLERVQVDFSGELGGEVYRWDGLLIRSEGVVDEVTRSIHVIASVLPTESQSALTLPPTGMFLNASIMGKTLLDVIAIPRRALIDRTTVLVLNEKDVLVFKTVKIVRREAENVYVNDGLEDGERIVLTNIESPLAGTIVEVEKASQVEEDAQ